MYDGPAVDFRVCRDANHDVIPMHPDNLIDNVDLLYSLFTTLELRPNNFRYYDRSRVVQWNINTVPLQLRIPGLDEKTSFLPQRGHDNMDHFIPKQLLDFDISSNRDLLKIFHSYCRDMGIFTPDCDKIGILNADVNIYLRLVKVTNNCFWNGIVD